MVVELRSNSGTHAGCSGGASRRVRAHEAVGEERERLWQRDMTVYPGRAAYERRAAHRRIPVVVLAPVSDETT